MARKKWIGIGVLVVLTLANIFLARLVSRVRGSHSHSHSDNPKHPHDRTPSNKPHKHGPADKPPQPSVHVIKIPDIHPIQHLMDAGAFDAPVSHNNNNNNNNGGDVQASNTDLALAMLSPNFVSDMKVKDGISFYNNDNVIGPGHQQEHYQQQPQHQQPQQQQMLQQILQQLQQRLQEQQQQIQQQQQQFPAPAWHTPPSLSKPNNQITPGTGNQFPYIVNTHDAQAIPNTQNVRQQPSDTFNVPPGPGSPVNQPRNPVLGMSQPNHQLSPISNNPGLDMSQPNHELSPIANIPVLDMPQSTHVQPLGLDTINSPAIHYKTQTNDFNDINNNINNKVYSNNILDQSIGKSANRTIGGQVKPSGTGVDERDQPSGDVTGDSGLPPGFVSILDSMGTPEAPKDAAPRGQMSNLSDDDKRSMIDAMLDSLNDGRQGGDGGTKGDFDDIRNELTKGVMNYSLGDISTWLKAKKNGGFNVNGHNKNNNNESNNKYNNNKPNDGNTGRSTSGSIPSGEPKSDGGVFTKMVANIADGSGIDPLSQEGREMRDVFKQVEDLIRRGKVGQV